MYKKTLFVIGAHICAWMSLGYGLVQIFLKYNYPVCCFMARFHWPFKIYRSLYAPPVQHSTTVRFAHIVFMCFAFIWYETATCATYNIKWLVFIAEMKTVYSALRTGYLNRAVFACSVSRAKQSITFMFYTNQQIKCSLFSNTLPLKCTQHATRARSTMDCTIFLVCA